MTRQLPIMSARDAPKMHPSTAKRSSVRSLSSGISPTFPQPHLPSPPLSHPRPAAQGMGARQGKTLENLFDGGGAFRLQKAWHSKKPARCWHLRLRKQQLERVEFKQHVLFRDAAIQHKVVGASHCALAVDFGHRSVSHSDAPQIVLCRFASAEISVLMQDVENVLQQTRHGYVSINFRAGLRGCSCY